MKTKLHAILRGEDLDEVDRIAGKRKRSLLIAEATREKLKKEPFLKVLDETKGAWGHKNHPDLRTGRDVDKYVRSKRHSYRKRIKTLAHE